MASGLSPHKDVEKLSKEDNDAYRFRRYLSQFLAATVKMMMTFQFGLTASFTGIINSALSGHSNEHNRNETLRITGAESSWLGSIIYIFQPIGSAISAVTTDYLGRKRAMMIVNIPLAIAWILMYQSNSVLQIFIANSLLGLSVGLMEAPIMTFLGEIAEPATRGILISYTNLGTSLGGFVIFSLNTLLPWRSVALVCFTVPIVTLIALMFLPETPQWLISKGQIERAEKSLCWVRGWAPRDQVASEFQILQTFVERSKLCSDCKSQQNQQCSHAAPSFAAKLAEFQRKQTLKPFLIVMGLFVIVQYSGMFAMTPYLVNIFKAYGSPLPADVTTAISSFLNVFATITFMSLEHFVGKRRLYLTVLSGVCVSSAIISVYGFICLPRGFNSFDHSEVPILSHPMLAYIPTICLILWSFCSYCGILMMPWQMLSELFPFKTRGFATGMAASIDYLMAFLTIKTYFNLETSLSLPGVSLLYCTVATIGLILMFNILPETENRSLEDIERHFADDTKKWTDWRIPKHVKQVK